MLSSLEYQAPRANELETFSLPASAVPQGATGADRANARQPMKRYRRLGQISLSALALMALGTLAHMRTVHDEAAEIDVASNDGTVPTVSVATPTAVSAVPVTLPATIRPWQTTALHSRVTGYLTAWHVELGAPVKAGQLLAELETPDLDQEVSEGESQAVEAAAAVAQAQAEFAEQESELNVSIAKSARATAEVELARAQFARREKLMRTRAISQDEFDTFQKDLEARVADLAAANADVTLRRSNLKTRTATIEARQATMKSRLANLERLRELQAFKRIVAPFDGTVTQRSAEVGMLVRAGAEALFQIEDMSRVRVQVHVPQSTSVGVAVGAEASVRLPESSQKPVQATITRITSSIDSANRTMLAEIELDNRVHSFRPGSYAQVTLTSTSPSADWTIPANSLQMRATGPHIALVNSRDEVETRPVVLGRNLGDRVMVLNGLQGDERLIINPSSSLTGGEKVLVKERMVLANSQTAIAKN